MTPLLVALVGPSRSGKGTCARIFAQEAGALGLTHRERQFSGPGKQYVASAWRPDITEEEAIAWFDELKTKRFGAEVVIREAEGYVEAIDEFGTVPLQKYLQRMLQGARDRWGDDFWTDKLLPGPKFLTTPDGRFGPYTWWRSFSIVDDELAWDEACFANLALISDLRQVNEAKRVKACRGYVVEMDRARELTNDPYVTSPDHVTEQRLPPELVDWVVPNIGDVADLEDQCRACWRDFVLPRLQGSST